MSGERARFRSNAFLHATVTRQTNAMLIENAVLRSVEPFRRHFHRDRDADSVTNSLSERTGCAFDPGRFKKFRMSRRFRMQLPETFDLRHRQIVAAHVQPRVEEHRAVTGRQNEIIAANPPRFVWIVL